MRHKFMFALQKNVNSPIRSSIAKIWLKFIENPPVNAIFFQDSFSRWGRKSGKFVAHGEYETSDRTMIPRNNIRKIILFSLFFVHLTSNRTIISNIRNFVSKPTSFRGEKKRGGVSLWKDFKRFRASGCGVVVCRGIDRGKSEVVREGDSLILAGDRSDRGR